jgi:hypothetical protein
VTWEELLRVGRRCEGLHVGRVASWVSLVVDDGGVVLVDRELVLAAPPAVVVPAIMAARMVDGKRERQRLVYAGPAEIVGKPPEDGWASPPHKRTLRDEFHARGLHLLPANEDRVAGAQRVAELRRLDSELGFPEWHPRHGSLGSRRLYLAGSCTRVLEQLGSAPEAEDDEPGAGVAVSARWEKAAGGLFAALRYAVMSWSAPAEKPERTEWESPRDRIIEQWWGRDRAEIEREDARRPGIDRSRWMG